MLRLANLKYIADISPDLGENIKYFFEKHSTGVMFLQNLSKDLPIPQKEDAAGMAGRKSIMRHHENGRTQFSIDALNC